MNEKITGADDPQVAILDGRVGVSAWRLLLDVWQEFFLGVLTFASVTLVAINGYPTLAAAVALLLFLLFTEFTPVRAVASLALVMAILFFAQVLSGTSPVEMGASLLLLLIPGGIICSKRRYPKRVFSLLGEMTEELLRQNSADSVAFCAVAFITKHKRFQHAYIQLLDKETDELVLVAGSHLYQVGARLQRPRGVGWRCLQTGRRVMVMDTGRDLDYIPNAIAAQSAILVPLVSGGKRFGVLAAESTLWRYFNARDLELLSLFASQLSFVFQVVEGQESVHQATLQQKAVLREKDEEIERLRKALRASELS